MTAPTSPQPARPTARPTARPDADPDAIDTATIDPDAIDTATTITVRPWPDPLVDEIGHDPRSRYVERFWLGVLGPTATWLLRRLVAGLDASPEGYEIDLAATASSMGLAYSPHRASPFARALQRCSMFGVTHATSDGIAVRRRIPPVAHRHLRRLPAALQAEHDRWAARTPSLDDFARAHSLGMAMLDAGDDPDAIEYQLAAVGVDAPTAATIAENLRELRAQRAAS